MVAFCDQDDVWLNDRLRNGVSTLAQIDPDTPALYCGRLWITDEALGNRRLSEPRRTPELCPKVGDGLIRRRLEVA